QSRRRRPEAALVGARLRSRGPRAPPGAAFPRRSLRSLPSPDAADPRPRWSALAFARAGPGPLQAPPSLVARSARSSVQTPPTRGRVSPKLIDLRWVNPLLCRGFTASGAMNVDTNSLDSIGGLCKD